MIHIRQIDHIKTVASFIAQHNQDAKQHVGYCGTDAEELLDTLLHEFSEGPVEQSWLAAYDDERLVGVLGLDITSDDQEAEIWGPFIEHENWEQIALQLWESLLASIPFSLRSAYGFYNLHNQSAQAFMQKLGAQREGEHLLLSFHHKDALSSLHVEVSIEALDSLHEREFITLHDEVFKHAYYNGASIMERQDPYNQVYGAVQDNKLLGYVYVEANPEHGDGDIHFIAVNEAARGKGLGTALLQRALVFLTSHESIQQITLCVSLDNHGAISIYERAGFKRKHHLISYKVHIQ